jgi:hypothetical protein
MNYSEMTDEELYSNKTIKSIPDVFGFIDYSAETSRRFKAKGEELAKERKERERLVNRLNSDETVKLAELTRLRSQLSDAQKENERQRATLQRWTSIREANHWEDWVKRWIHLFESKEQADDVYYSARSDVEVHYQEGVRFLELSREQVASLRSSLREADEELTVMRAAYLTLTRKTPAEASVEECENLDKAEHFVLKSTERLKEGK